MQIAGIKAREGTRTYTDELNRNDIFITSSRKAAVYDTPLYDTALINGDDDGATGLVQAQ